MASVRLYSKLDTQFGFAGKLLAMGYLKFYLAGTLTPADVYADKSLSVNNGSTVALDVSGRPAVEAWADVTSTFFVELYDANNVKQGDADNVGMPGGVPQLVPVPSPGQFITGDGTNFILSTISQVPDPTGKAGQVLESDGTNYGWSASISNITMRNVRDVVQSLTAAATLSVDLTLGAVIVLTHGVDCVLTITNIPVSGEAMAFTIVRVKDNSGTARALSIASAKWPGGVAVPLTQTANAIDVISCLAYNGNAAVLGSYNSGLA